MVHANPGFVAGPGDALTVKTLPVFFGLLDTLLDAGVTVVAEAAFQDHVWQPRLGRLRSLADIRIIVCVVGATVRSQRIARRRNTSPTRAAHADPGPAHGDPGPAHVDPGPAHGDLGTRREAGHFANPGARTAEDSFTLIASADARLDVDTTSGYSPPLQEIVAFINREVPG